MKNALSSKQLKSLIAKTEASLRSLRGALNTRVETENDRRAKTLRNLEGVEKLDACLTPVTTLEAFKLGARSLKAADRKKVVRWFKRLPLSGTSEFHIDFYSKQPALYAKSKSGNIYQVMGLDSGRCILNLHGRGRKP